MFSLLLPIPTVYIHRDPRWSLSFLKEDRKGTKLCLYRIFQYRRKSVIYQYFKNITRITIIEKSEGTQTEVPEYWRPEDGLFSAFCIFLAGTREFVTHSRNGLIETCSFKKAKLQSEHHKHLWLKENQTKPHLQVRLTPQLRSRFPTWTEKCMIQWMVLEVGPVV